MKLREWPYSCVATGAVSVGSAKNINKGDEKNLKYKHIPISEGRFLILYPKQ